MPIGTSDGEVFKDRLEYLTQGVAKPKETNDNNVVTPDQADDNKQKDKIQNDDLGGIPVSNKGTITIRSLNPNLPDLTNKSGLSQLGDDLFGTGKNDIRPTLMGAATGVKNALALPGDVLSGKVPAGSTQEIERAADLAGRMVTGPAPVASKMADGTLGSFMGVRSKNFDPVRLSRAQELEMDAVHPDDIWMQTQTFRGADTRWRQEIDDSTSRLKMDNLIGNEDEVKLMNPGKDFF